MNYLLYGNETYNLQNRQKEIIKELSENDQMMNISYYSSTEKVNIDEVIDDLSMASLFDDNKVVVYRNPTYIDGRTNADEIALNKVIKYLKNPNETSTFIMVYDGNVGSDNKAFKELVKYVKYEKFDYLTDNEFKTLVVKDINESKIKIEPRAVSELQNRLPNNIQNWKNELAKLVQYPGRITVDTIMELVSKPLENNIFELSNGVVACNLSKAISVYRDLLVFSKNDVSSIIGLLANQFRQMATILVMSEERMSMKEMMDAVGTKSEYRVNKIMEACGYLKKRELYQLLDELANLDQNIKTGAVEPITAAELFIIKACRRNYR